MPYKTRKSHHTMRNPAPRTMQHVTIKTHPIARLGQSISRLFALCGVMQQPFRPNSLSKPGPDLMCTNSKFANIGRVLVGFGPGLVASARSLPDLGANAGAQCGRCLAGVGQPAKLCRPSPTPWNHAQFLAELGQALAEAGPVFFETKAWSERVKF